MDGRIDAYSLGLVNLVKSTDKFSEKNRKIYGNNVRMDTRRRNLKTVFVYIYK